MNQDLKARVSTWLQQHRGDIVRDIFTLSRIKLAHVGNEFVDGALLEHDLMRGQK